MAVVPFWAFIVVTDYAVARIAKEKPVLVSMTAAPHRPRHPPNHHFQNRTVVEDIAYSRQPDVARSAGAGRSCHRSPPRRHADAADGHRGPVPARQHQPPASGPCGVPLSCGVRPAWTRSTSCCRNSGGYGFRDLDIVDSFRHKTQVSTKPGQLQRRL